MLDDKRAGRKPRTSARLAVAFGVIATLAANIASAHPMWTARAVAAVPPVAFLLAVEVLSRRCKLIRPEPVATEPVDLVKLFPFEPTPEPVAADRAEPVKAQPVERRNLPSRKPVPRSLTSADRVMSAHLAQAEATNQRIGDLAGMSLATVKRYRPKRSAKGSAITTQPAQLPLTEPLAG